MRSQNICGPSDDLTLTEFILEMKLVEKDSEFAPTTLSFMLVQENKKFCKSIVNYYINREYSFLHYLSQAILKNPALALTIVKTIALNLCKEFHLELANSLMEDLNKLAVELDNVDYLVTRANIYW